MRPLTAAVSNRGSFCVFHVKLFWRKMHVVEDFFELCRFLKINLRIILKFIDKPRKMCYTIVSENRDTVAL